MTSWVAPAAGSARGADNTRTHENWIPHSACECGVLRARAAGSMAHTRRLLWGPHAQGEAGRKDFFDWKNPLKNCGLVARAGHLFSDGSAYTLAYTLRYPANTLGAPCPGGAGREDF